MFNYSLFSPISTLLHGVMPMPFPSIIWISQGVLSLYHFVFGKCLHHFVFWKCLLVPSTFQTFFEVLLFYRQLSVICPSLFYSYWFRQFLYGKLSNHIASLILVSIIKHMFGLAFMALKSSLWRYYCKYFFFFCFYRESYNWQLPKNYVCVCFDAPLNIH